MQPAQKIRKAACPQCLSSPEHYGRAPRDPPRREFRRSIPIQSRAVRLLVPEAINLTGAVRTERREPARRPIDKTDVGHQTYQLTPRLHFGYSGHAPANIGRTASTQYPPCPPSSPYRVFFSKLSSSPRSRISSRAWCTGWKMPISRKTLQLSDDSSSVPIFFTTTSRVISRA